MLIGTLSLTTILLTHKGREKLTWALHTSQEEGMVQGNGTADVAGRRDSIWSVRQRWRIWHSALWLLQMAIVMGYHIWLEIVVHADDTIIDTVMAIWERILPTGGTAAISTILILEVLDMVLGTRDAINRWAEDMIERRKQKRIAKAKAEGIEIGTEKGKAEGKAAGKAEGIRLMQEWLARKEQAAKRGEDFNEPPPTA